MFPFFFLVLPISRHISSLSTNNSRCSLGRKGKKNDVDLPPQCVWFPIPPLIAQPLSPLPSLILRYYDPILRSHVWRTHCTCVAYNFNLLCFNQRYKYVPIIRQTAFSRCPGKLDGYECRVFASNTYWIRLSDMLPIIKNVYWRNQDRYNEIASLRLSLSYHGISVSKGGILDLKLIISSFYVFNSKLEKGIGFNLSRHQ